MIKMAICPIMSRPIHSPQYDITPAITQLYVVNCFRERCEAWNKDYEYCKLIEGVSNE